MSATRWWLTPGAAYTPDAEAALGLCAGLMARPNPDPEDADKAWTQLRLHVADTDPFWLSWRAWRRMAGFPARGTPSTETPEESKAIGAASAARWRGYEVTGPKELLEQARQIIPAWLDTSPHRDDIQSQRNETAKTPAIGAPVTAPAESEE